MSKMQELYDKVAANQGLQNEFTEIMKRAMADNAEEMQKEMLGFAKKQGYDVTLEEMTAFFEGMAAAGNELSETELDAVAGGKSSIGEFSVVFSVFSLGVTCAVVSIYAAAERSGCSETFE